MLTLGQGREVYATEVVTLVQLDHMALVLAEAETKLKPFIDSLLSLAAHHGKDCFGGVIELHGRNEIDDLILLKAEALQLALDKVHLTDDWSEVNALLIGLVTWQTKCNWLLGAYLDLKAVEQGLVLDLSLW